MKPPKQQLLEMLEGWGEWHPDMAWTIARKLELATGGPM